MEQIGGSYIPMAVMVAVMMTPAPAPAPAMVAFEFGIRAGWKGSQERQTSDGGGDGRREKHGPNEPFILASFQRVPAGGRVTSPPPSSPPGAK